MTCKYCELIHSLDDEYPLRQATRDVASDYPRCDWHWRFVCSLCGKPRHFNGITWCDKTKQFICLSCARSHRIIPRTFWNWKLCYAIECESCRRYHPALDYLEFLGKHPWQLHPSMQKLREGIDPEVKLPESKSIHVPLDKAAVSEKQVSHAWDELADKWISGYTEYGDMNREYVIDPVIFRLLGSINGLSILDAGCGGGYLCRQLARKGAKVVGVDISKKFIEIAEKKEKEDPLNIKYYAESLHNLPMFKDKTFDIIISNLVLMDVADLDKAIKELRRVLKKSGKLVFSIMHPCFPSPTVHGWMRKPRDSDRKEDRLYWMVDRYFDRTMETWQFYDWPAAYSFHRPLSDYMKMLLKNGFVITDFEEPIPSKKAIREHYREFGNEYDRIPWFLIIGAKKE